jgi:hypothetical protein
MCLRCEKRRPDESETTAVVLHEFGHAWMNSYLRERYGVDYLSPAVRRPFLDEGAADWIAGQWDSDFLRRRRRWIVQEKVSQNIPAPSLGDLGQYASFYDRGDRELHYWIAALLVERMLGSDPRDGSRIRGYLDLVGRGEAPERAFETATGKSLASEYACLVAELWRSP